MAKLKIKIGPVEVEYDGDDKFLKDELPSLLKAVRELHQASGLGAEEKGGVEKDGDKPRRAINGQLSTSVIASKLGCKKGPELAEAAAFNLAHVRSKESFTRDDLTTEMRSAKTFFKKNYVSNLTAILRRMVADQKLNEVSANVFSVPDQAAQNMKGRLGI